MRDVTSSYGVLSVAGPKARDLLAAVTNIDLSSETLPLNCLQDFHIGHAPVFAQHLSYTGEHGWEIFISPDFAEHVFEALMDAGAPLGHKLVGGAALNALRIEMGFLHWGHNLAYTEVPYPVGLGVHLQTEQSDPLHWSRGLLSVQGRVQRRSCVSSNSLTQSDCCTTRCRSRLTRCRPGLPSLSWM
nr:hypothetical protein [Aliiroseovarius sp. S1339]